MLLSYPIFDSLFNIKAPALIASFSVLSSEASFITRTSPYILAFCITLRIVSSSENAGIIINFLI